MGKWQFSELLMKGGWAEGKERSLLLRAIQKWLQGVQKEGPCPKALTACLK